jgi:hypothetical protein
MGYDLESSVVIFYLVAEIEPFRTETDFKENVFPKFVIEVNF